MLNPLGVIVLFKEYNVPHELGTYEHSAFEGKCRERAEGHPVERDLTQPR